MVHCRMTFDLVMNLWIQWGHPLWGQVWGHDAGAPALGVSQFLLVLTFSISPWWMGSQFNLLGDCPPFVVCQLWLALSWHIKHWLWRQFSVGFHKHLNIPSLTANKFNKCASGRCREKGRSALNRGLATDTCKGRARETAAPWLLDTLEPRLESSFPM